MDPDEDFAPGHSYVNSDNKFKSPYLILARNENAVAFLVLSKKVTGISTYAFLQPIHFDWEHSDECRCREHQDG